MDIAYWIIIIVGLILNICVLVWIFEIRENSKRQVEMLRSQIELLAGLAEKSGVPLKDINEIVGQYDIEYE